MALAFPLRVIFEQMIFSFKEGSRAMVMALTSLAVSTALAILLGFGGLGVPRFGFPGVAISYALGECVTALLYGLYLKFGRVFKDFSFFDFCQRVEGFFEVLKKMFEWGMGISFGLFNEKITNLIISLIAGFLGASALSALGVAYSYSYLIFIPGSAFSGIIAQEVAGKIGEGAKYHEKSLESDSDDPTLIESARIEYKQASENGRFGLATELCYILPLPIFFAIFPEVLARILNLDESIAQMLPSLLWIVSLGVISDAVCYNLLMQLRPLGENKTAMVVSFLSMLCAIPTAWFLGLKTPLGINGVAAGYTSIRMIEGAFLWALSLNKSRPSQIEAMQARAIEAKALASKENEVLKAPSHCCDWFLGNKKPEENLNDIPMVPVTNYLSVSNI